MTSRRPAHFITSSEYGTLAFPDGETYRRFQERERALWQEFFNEIRRTDGIWAGNQDRFVDTPEELNEWDPKSPFLHT